MAVGVSQLLSGWGRLYLNGNTARPYPLQIMASVLLLVALLQSIWGYWGLRNVTWDFGRFIVVLTPLLPLVGAAYLVIPPASGTASDSTSPRDHYFAVHRVIFSLLAMWVALGTVAELVLVEPTPHLGHAVRLIGVIVLLGLGLTARPAFHWAGLAVRATLQLLFVRIVTPALD